MKSRATSSGVLAMANCTPSKASGRSSSTVYGVPANVIVLPAERFEARNLIVRKGNFRDSSSLQNDGSHGAGGADDGNGLVHGSSLPGHPFA